MAWKGGDVRAVGRPVKWLLPCLRSEGDDLREQGSDVGN